MAAAFNHRKQQEKEKLSAVQNGLIIRGLSTEDSDLVRASLKALEDLSATYSKQAAEEHGDSRWKVRITPVLMSELIKVRDNINQRTELFSFGYLEPSMISEYMKDITATHLSSGSESHEIDHARLGRYIQGLNAFAKLTRKKHELPEPS